MGLNHSKESEGQGKPKTVGANGSHLLRDSRHEPVTPRKGNRGHFHRQPDQHASPPRSSRSPEEEKLPERMDDAHIKDNLATMFHFIDHVGTRRHSSSNRAAVHPIDDELDHHHHTSHSRRIESLPPPMHELQRDERRGGSSSLPVRCPSRTSTSRPRGNDATLSGITDDDSEYLSKLYDLRTWNMYKLITESRKQRSLNYVPSVIAEEAKSMDGQEEEADLEDAEELNSFTTNMIFAFDL